MSGDGPESKARDAAASRGRWMQRDAFSDASKKEQNSESGLLASQLLPFLKRFSRCWQACLRSNLNPQPHAPSGSERHFVLQLQ
jgi:hypothetical protein